MNVEEIRVEIVVDGRRRVVIYSTAAKLKELMEDRGLFGQLLRNLEALATAVT